jgi:hypothetical protein
MSADRLHDLEPIPEAPLMHSHYVFLALEVARERAAEADARRLSALAHPADPVGARIRRGIARAALAIARAADEDVRPVSIAGH